MKNLRYDILLIWLFMLLFCGLAWVGILKALGAE
jgi:hypothetical protein